MKNVVLSLSELESFDPQSPRREGERRFLCPFCGLQKPRDNAHRSLCLNVASGLWNCKRCGQSGKLQEFFEAKSSRLVARAALKRAFDLPQAVPLETPQHTDFRAIWARCIALDREESRAGRSYLASRAISPEIAQASDVRFCADWNGRACVVFPFRDAGGELVALSGRALRDGGLDKPASGPKKNGAFWASWNGFSPFDPRLPAVVICEAPFDALSLAMAGCPAIAIGGTAPPVWLHQKCAFRSVFLALDADEAGDTASAKIAAHLASFGAKTKRLRPQGAKDWNELLLQIGRDQLDVQLCAHLLAP